MARFMWSGGSFDYSSVEEMLVEILVRWEEDQFGPLPPSIKSTIPQWVHEYVMEKTYGKGV